MAIYRYDSGSLLDEVRLIKNSAGGVRACLHARTDASADQLASIQQHLTQQGFKAVPIFEEGKHYLEVRGLKNPEEFTRDLGAAGFVNGTAAIEHTPDEKMTRAEKLKAMTLKATGIVYNVGDAAYMTYALMDHHHEKQKFAHLTGKEHADAMRGSHLNIAGGVGYALGSALLTAYGSKDQSQNEIKDATSQLKRYLKNEGILVPDSSAVDLVTRKEKQTVGQKVNGFLRRYPSEALNTVYTAVGLFLMGSSINKVRTAKATGQKYFGELLDVGLGITTATSALIGLLVKEKKPNPDEPKKHGLAKAWQWIEEKPLRATGMGYFISTLWHAGATGVLYKQGDAQVKKTVVFRGIFVLANIVSEFLLFISSKGHGQGVKTDNSVEKTVLASAAEIVAQQPHEKQDALIQQLAGHMASPEILGGKAEDIAKDLHAQVAHIQANPWVAHKLAAAAPVMMAEEAPQTIHEETPSTKVSHVDHASHQKHQLSHVHHDAEHKAESSHTAQGDSWKDHAQHTKQHAHTAAASV